MSIKQVCSSPKADIAWTCADFRFVPETDLGLQITAILLPT
jgi:hypothetical protein